jgi:hypothetical protein
VGVQSSAGGSMGFEALAVVPPQATASTSNADARTSKAFFIVM